MTALIENDLQFDFPNVVNAMKFDQDDSDHPEFHDLRNMPKVDFIIEETDAIFFIEVKDPGKPGAADVGSTRFLKKVVNGTLEASLIEKYIFSFFFRWAEEKLEKSVHYITLVTLETGLLQTIIDGLEDQLSRHFSQQSIRWERNPLTSCQVHNIETWEAVFPDWPITRLSAVATN
jgi:hypothetical protein